jgi:hypothetical protein
MQFEPELITSPAITPPTMLRGWHLWATWLRLLLHFLVGGFVGR